MNEVATPSAAVQAMMEDWELIDAVHGGTRTMRDAARTYLPQRPLEEGADYRDRLKMATLFPALRETVSAMTGRVFADPLMLPDDMPAWIKDGIAANIDMQDRNLHVFAREWFRSGLLYGLSHVLIEAPRSSARTRAEELSAGLRPYAILIEPRRVLGWRAVGGTLVQLRVAFEREEPAGEFGVRKVKQVRVYEPNRVRVYELGERDWVPVDDIRTGFSQIPIATFYTGRTGLMTATPPLLDLAFLNAKHWAMQSANDQLIDTASVPILAMYGVQDGDTVVIGAKHAVRLPADARMTYVEHTGAAIGAGRTALDAVKDEMRQAGAKLLQPGSGTKTATQASEDAARENSALAAMAQDFEDSLDAMLDLIAATRGEATAGSGVTVNANLDPDFAPAETMQALFAMRNAGALSDARLFAEAQRRGIVDDSVDWEDEQTRIAEQARV